MSDPLGHILSFYFADVLIGNEYHDGPPVGLQQSPLNYNYLNMENTTHCRVRSTGAAPPGGYDMVDGDNNSEESQDQMEKFEEVAHMLAKIGDNVNEQYKLPEWNPTTSFDSQIEDLLAERVGQPEVQQIALVLRFAKDVVKIAANKEKILTATRSFITGHFSRWCRQYET